MAFDRRELIAALSGLGAALAAGVRPEELEAQGAPGAIPPPGGLTADSLAQAEKVLGLEFTAAEREMMLKGVQQNLESYRKLRAVPLPNAVAPALRFAPQPPGSTRPQGASAAASPGAASRPGTDDELAFLSATELSRLLAARQVSSVELTRLYLARLERFDPVLHCVVTLTRERALAEAERADRERAAGTVRGPLHGIPWGAKDLLAAQGYPTTWGAEPFATQTFPEDATVVRRLTEAGAVLVAKLSLGALAWGDVWIGGVKTRNPWKPEDGSSGSSAGSASAAAAGLVGFAIGSETLGSIVSPATRCGATGLRPTFGRVSRAGAMALSWSMDKLGPLARSVEDCALIFAAIHGADPGDPSAVDAPFAWQPEADPKQLRLGYVKAFFEAAPPEGLTEAQLAAFREGQQNDRRTLETLEGMGFRLIPIELPTDLPLRSLSFVLSAEAAAAFDELTRSNRDEMLARQEEQAWPNVFRQARFIPAVEYIQANRVRSLLLDRMAAVMQQVDAYVVPSTGNDNLVLNNLTGHPAVVLPNGFRQDGTPTSISFVGELFEEGKLLRIAKAYQDETGFHRRHPGLAQT